MGNWNISVRGIGPHHNNQPFDADKMAARFVRDLLLAGHGICGADITHGGCTDLRESARGWPECTKDAPTDKAPT